MYLHSKLDKFDGKINIAFIGCGKFISMFLAQYNHLQKIKIDTIVDLDINRAKSNCIKSGLTKETVEQIIFVNSQKEQSNLRVGRGSGVYFVLHIEVD